MILLMKRLTKTSPNFGSDIAMRLEAWLFLIGKGQTMIILVFLRRILNAPVYDLEHLVYRAFLE